MRLMSDNELADALSHFERRRAEKEAFELLAWVKPTGRMISHLAAQDLKGYKDWICRAAEENRRGFFVELGMLLEGKRLKPDPWTKLDEDIAFILCYDPKIKSTDAVRLLRQLGHPSISSLAFKQKKYNWKRAAIKARKKLESKGVQFYAKHSFLDSDNLDDPDDETIKFA